MTNFTSRLARGRLPALLICAASVGLIAFGAMRARSTNANAADAAAARPLRDDAVIARVPARKKIGSWQQ